MDYIIFMFRYKRNLEARRFECNLHPTPLRDSLYTFPIPHRCGAWLGIAHDLFIRHLGFPEFTSFSVCLSTESCVTPDIISYIHWRISSPQSIALPLSYSGILFCKQTSDILVLYRNVFILSKIP